MIRKEDIMKLIINKKGIEMPFAWIFALIIGGVILLLAFIFSGKILNTGTYATEAELARSLDILLNPFSSIRQADVTLSKPIDLPEKTEVTFSCNALSDSQSITVSIERGKKPFVYPIKNKYIFSENFNTKSLRVFGKTFDMPWKVDDLTYVLSKDYCFVKAPPKIEKELEDLNITKITLVNAATDPKCQNKVTVCFAGMLGVCNIKVDYTGKTLTVNKTTLKFLDDSTMYAAIFDSKNYNCNLNRTMKRLALQADILLQKADKLASEGCTDLSDLRQDILAMKTAASNKDYLNVLSYAQAIETKNPDTCPLY